VRSLTSQTELDWVDVRKDHGELAWLDGLLFIKTGPPAASLSDDFRTGNPARSYWVMMALGPIAPVNRFVTFPPIQPVFQRVFLTIQPSMVDPCRVSLRFRTSLSNACPSTPEPYGNDGWPEKASAELQRRRERATAV